MPVPELQPAAAKIDRVISRIADGDIKIPAFQRGFVWDQDQVVKFIDSVYNYSTASLLDVFTTALGSRMPLVWRCHYAS